MNPKNPTVKLLAVTWLVLVALHFTILGSAYLRLGGFNTPLILLLAVVQMVLVIGYFMEVRYAVSLIWIVAAAGFFWLGIQWVLTLSDYLMRQWH